MILIYPRPRVARPGVTSADPRCDSKYPLPALRPMGTTITRKRLAATPSSCLALLVIQLLIEVALINLEASNVQRISQRDVALNACRVCRRAESPQPNRLTRLGQPFALTPRYLLGPVGCVPSWGYVDNSPHAKHLERLLDVLDSDLSGRI